MKGGNERDRRKKNDIGCSVRGIVDEAKRSEGNSVHCPLSSAQRPHYRDCLFAVPCREITADHLMTDLCRDETAQMSCRSNCGTKPEMSANDIARGLSVTVKLLFRPITIAMK